MSSPTSDKKVPRPASVHTPDQPGEQPIASASDRSGSQPDSRPGERPDRPEPPPQVASLTDLTHVDTIYAPQVKTTRLRTIHIKHDPAIPAPSRATASPLALDAVPLAQALLARLDVDQEHFIMLTCTAKHRVYGFKHITSGGQTELLIDPAIAFRSALLLGAAFIIVIHNHPSGDPTPSTEDLRLTARLLTFGDIINIPLLDHLILGREGEAVSLRTHHAYLWP